ncbi:glycine cleavage system P-family protein [Mycobacteroides abscessus subsp. bolletii 1513]|uniref:Glycine cleavage system P-family protein n=1 Tax=Mycobacteroides abscessus subsp. bolletii 1513 TaxID=1299321 RepID=X8DNI2_9MYCO|nr:glycine cleavage system P-family protein [Mycobacteroides abscessus subsp. bolletii 1513]
MSRDSASGSAMSFANRHIGPTTADIDTMLATIGVASLDELAEKAVPASILDTLRDGLASGLDVLPVAASEYEALDALRKLASQNTVAVSMIGQGYFDTLTPPVLRRHILENPAWYTAYTPYQPEISQGRLEALLNFQTMVAELTGLDIANASMLDEGTAAAEAMTLMHRAVKSASNRLVVDGDLYPQTAAVIATRAQPLGIDVVTADLAAGLPEGDFFGVIVQLPGPPGGARLDVADLCGARARRAGRGRCGPAGPYPRRSARRHRRRRRLWHHTALRCADGLRWAARGVSRGAYRPCPPAAGTPRRSLGGCRRFARIPAFVADPRTAHPSGQGHQQHLYRTGVTGCDGRDVCELPRSGRVACHRRPDPPQCAAAGLRPDTRRPHRGA